MKFRKITALFAAAAMALSVAWGLPTLADDTEEDETSTNTTTTTYTASEEDLTAFAALWTLTDATVTVDTDNSRIQFASTASSSDSSKGIATLALIDGNAYTITFNYKMNTYCKLGFISSDGTTSTRSYWDNGSSTRDVTITVDEEGNGTYTDSAGSITAADVVGLYVYADTTSRKVSINAPMVITEIETPAETSANTTTTTYTASEEDLTAFAALWTLTDATVTVDTDNSRIQFASAASSSDSSKGIATLTLNSGSAYEISFTYKMNNLCAFGFISSDGTVATRSYWDNGSSTRDVTITIDEEGNGTYTDSAGSVTAADVVGLYAYADTTSRKVSINAPIVITETKATAEETEAPTETEEPTEAPTEEPTEEPTVEPTAEPTEEPTAEPTEEPTAEPTEEPTEEPAENRGTDTRAYGNRCGYRHRI